MKYKNQLGLCFAILMFFCAAMLFSCAGCGGVKMEDSIPKEKISHSSKAQNKTLIDDNQDNTKNINQTNTISAKSDSSLKPEQQKYNTTEEILNRNLNDKRIIASDSTYAIVFYDENGDSIST